MEGTRNAYDKNCLMPHTPLDAISKYRGELMGIAMLFVILFHVGLPRDDAFFGLRRMGNIGVDYFLFLSGMGLWFSWKKNPGTFRFIARRLTRIYPAWIIAAGTFYISDFLGDRKFSNNIIDLLGDITFNWDFWLHDELTFWYIPATMMLYVLTPAYIKLISKYPVYRWLPVAMIMWCVIVQWVTPIHDAVGHLEIFWSRMPIYFIGVNIGEAVMKRKILDGSTMILILIIFTMALSTSIYLEQVKHGKFPLFIERMLYIPLTVTSILLIVHLLQHSQEWIRRIFRTVGALSLEAYLIHQHFVLDYIEKLHWHYWFTFMTCVAVTLPFAWALRWITNLRIRKTTK